MNFKTLNTSVKLRETAESGGNYLWVRHYEQPLVHYSLSFDTVLLENVNDSSFNLKKRPQLLKHLPHSQTRRNQRHV